MVIRVKITMTKASLFGKTSLEASRKLESLKTES